MRNHQLSPHGKFGGTNPDSSSHGHLFFKHKTREFLSLLPAGIFVSLLPTRSYAQAGSADTTFKTDVTTGADGTFYGVATYDGENGRGLLFRVTPAGTYTILHQFTGGADGAFPGDALVLASDGNFHGSTYGPSGDTGGSVFWMTPAGDFTPLYSFTGGADGGGAERLAQGDRRFPSYITGS